jgi:hypothetical protein
MVTLSEQQRREPLVGDLVSSPESVVLGDTLPNKRQVSDLQFTLPSAAARGVRSNIIPRYTLSLAPK